MIANDQELQTTLERITWFQQQLAHLRNTETNPVNYRAAASGFLAVEVDRTSSLRSESNSASFQPRRRGRPDHSGSHP